MIESKEEAMKLRGWHKILKAIGLGGISTVKNKEKQLQSLYNKLYSNYKTHGNRFMQFVAFNKIYQLINLDKNNKPLLLTITKNELNKELCYKIDNLPLFTVSTNKHEFEIIEKYINKDGSLNLKFNENFFLKEWESEFICPKIQKLVRGFLVRGRVDKETGFHKIINEKHKNIGFRSPTLQKVLEDPTDNHLTNNNLPRGAFKTMVYKHSGKSVGLIIHNKNSWERMEKVPAKILKIFNNTPRIVPQYQVTNNLLVAVDLGENLREIKYKLTSENLKDFKPLILDIERLHKKQIIHRDIKPDNMFLKNGEIYLSDVDFVANFENLGNGARGTEAYCPYILLLQPKKFGVAIDKYAMFSTLIELYFEKLPFQLGKKDIVDFIYKFIQPKYKECVRKFILDPETFKPTFKLSEVLKF